MAPEKAKKYLKKSSFSGRQKLSASASSHAYHPSFFSNQTRRTITATKKQCAQILRYDKTISAPYHRLAKNFDDICLRYDNCLIPQMEERHLLALTPPEKNDLLAFYKLCFSANNKFSEYLAYAAGIPFELQPSQADEAQTIARDWRKVLPTILEKIKILLGWELFITFDTRGMPAVFNAELYAADSNIEKAGLGLYASIDVPPHALLGIYPATTVRLSTHRDDKHPSPYQIETFMIRSNGEFDVIFDISNPSNIPAGELPFHRANMLAYFDPSTNGKICTPNSLQFIAYYAPDQSIVLDNGFTAPVIGALTSAAILANNEITATYSDNPVYKKHFAGVFGKSSLAYFQKKTGNMPETKERRYFLRS